MPTLKPGGTNVPVYALAALVVFTVSLVVLIITGHANGDLFAVFVVSTLPSLVAAMFAERTARDVRNGVLQDKVRQGTHEALHESGVSEIAANAQSLIPAQTDALARLVDSLDKHAARSAVQTAETETQP